jgi:uncharacterized membrane protein YfcA
MEFLWIPLAAFVASTLTLFSGFGLGTLLMPVAAVFFPVDVAIAMTAAVHLANNVFKGFLLGRWADREVFLRFGIPAVAAAFGGALLLGRLAGAEAIFAWEAFGRSFTTTALGLVVGILILLFVAIESSRRLASVALDPKWLPLGGIVSGFFGGLSGHQGAFRSMFLLKAGLDKQAFVATGVLIAIAVDLARTLVYGLQFAGARDAIAWPLVFTASLAAFLGAYLGARLLEKVTLGAVRAIVSALLIVIALGLMSGVL